MAQSHPQFPGQAYGRSQGQPSRQEVSFIFHPSPQKPSAVASSPITEAGSEGKYREDEYNEDVVCEQEEKCGRGAKGKRKQRNDSPPEGGGNQGPSSKKTKKGPIYACPFFKNDNLKYQECADWSTYETHRVKEHCKRCHLKPHLCYNCGNYRTGDQGQMKTHTAKCKTRAIEITEIPREDVTKAKSLDVRGLDWTQIYRTLFPGEKVPSPYWVENIALGTFPEPQVYPSFIPDIWLVDYTRYLQIQLKIMPDVMEALCRAYLNMLNLPYSQPLPPRDTPAEDDGTDVGYEYNNTHLPIHHPVPQPSSIPGTYPYITDSQSLSDELCGGSSSSQYPHRSTISTNEDETLPALSERHQFEPAGGRGPSYGYS